MLLDRYRREARQLETFGRKEVARARDVTAMVAPELTGRFDDRIEVGELVARLLP